MKTLKNLSVLLFVFALCTIFSCKHSIDTIAPEHTGQVFNPTPVHASVSGTVIDQDNHVVAGATVRSGTHTTITDNRGLFRFDNIEMDKYASVVSVEVNGYFKGIRTFSATEASSNFIKIKLIQKILTGTIDASAGGAVTLPDNSVVTLAANSVVVKSTGQAYTGNIHVYAAGIDPALNDIAETIPGSFQATDVNNFRVLLKSYGMLAVQLESQSGELLQIATGKTASLRFAIPSSLSSTAPATIPLWSLNENDGLWKEEGQATKTGNYYEGNVAHFSFWNCDQPNIAIYLELTINTGSSSIVNNAVPGAIVKITRINTGAFTHGYTDSSGHVGGFVYGNEPLLLEILNNCYVPIYTQNIGPYSQNTDLGVITLTTILPQYILTVTGNAVDCNNQPLANGCARIYFEGQLFNVSINNGSFSATLSRCSLSTDSLEIIAIDNSTNQSSAAWINNITGSSVNAGTLTACGASSDQFIYYNINGVDYAFIGPPDSINQTNTQPGYVTFNGSDNGSNYLYFKMSYTNIGLGTSQPVPTFWATQIAPASTYTFVSPMNATISEFGNIGEYIAGDFSGVIMTSGPTGNQTYNITCSFRTRRTY